MRTLKREMEKLILMNSVIIIQMLALQSMMMPTLNL